MEAVCHTLSMPGASLIWRECALRQISNHGREELTTRRFFGRLAARAALPASSARYSSEFVWYDHGTPSMKGTKTNQDLAVPSVVTVGDDR